MELTKWNKQLGISSLNSKSKLTFVERNMINLTPRARSIIIGLLLSDGWLRKIGHWNTRLGLKQSISNFNYFWLVYSELAFLCSGKPILGKSLLRGNLFYNISKYTRQLECLNDIFHLFYTYSPKWQ